MPKVYGNTKSGGKSSEVQPVGEPHKQMGILYDDCVYISRTEWSQAHGNQPLSALDKALREGITKKGNPCRLQPLYRVNAAQASDGVHRHRAKMGKGWA